MATLKQRLNRKNSSGTYDTVHLETSSEVVKRPSGETVENDLTNYLPKVQNSDSVPESLSSGLSIHSLQQFKEGVFIYGYFTTET